jgi:O-antigen biosynthesis protein WbqV
MTIPEAVQLVLHATALRSDDENVGLRKFVLEMGEPVKIVDLARQMIELSGNIPGADIAIQITGLRPGEKLTETLIDNNEISKPCVPGITEISSEVAEKLIGPNDVSALSALARSGDDLEVRELVASLLSAVRQGPAVPNVPRGRGRKVA